MKPTKFASLLAVEILDTLQNVLVKPEDIIVPATSQDTSAAEKKLDTDKEEKSKDLDDLHVTPWQRYYRTSGGYRCTEIRN